MKKLVVLCLTALLLGMGCENGKDSSKKATKSETDFTLRDLEGKEYTLSKQKSKAVIVDFWATWCGPCVASIPIFNELYEEYGSKGLLVLGVALDKEDALKKFLGQHKIDYPVLVGSQEIARKYGIRAIPATFIINKQGEIVSRHVGLIPNMKTTIEEEIKKLL
jgi:thiol-disulfide isomerase/thioredoxin